MTTTTRNRFSVEFEGMKLPAAIRKDFGIPWRYRDVGAGLFYLQQTAPTSWLGNLVVAAFVRRCTDECEGGIRPDDYTHFPYDGAH